MQSLYELANLEFDLAYADGEVNAEEFHRGDWKNQNLRPVEHFASKVIADRKFPTFEFLYHNDASLNQGYRTLLHYIHEHGIDTGAARRFVCDEAPPPERDARGD